MCLLAQQERVKEISFVLLCLICENIFISKKYYYAFSQSNAYLKTKVLDIRTMTLYDMNPCGNDLNGSIV